LFVLIFKTNSVDVSSKTFPSRLCTLMTSISQSTRVSTPTHKTDNGRGPA